MFDSLDVFVIDGLNARLNARTVGALMTSGPEAILSLADSPQDTVFWNLPRQDLADEAMVQERSAAYPLVKAWEILMRTPGIDVAVTHKFLHHKRPRLCPLLDGLTIHSLGRDSWVKIYDDVNDGREDFEHLETWFAGQAASRGGVELSRIRIHDILLWCSARGHSEAARSEGADLLGW